jgi:hypothetical protein
MSGETGQPDSGMPSRGRLRGAFTLAGPAGGVSRRGLVRAAGAGAVVAGSGGLLEACSSSSKGGRGDSTSGGPPGLVIGPSGDASGAADTAAINAVVGAGGSALLKKGTYYVTHLLPDSYGAILGTGPNTILQAVSGTAGYAIALRTPASTQQVMLADFTLKPDTGALGGIQIDNTGYGTGSDPQHTLENIYVLSAGGDGFHFGANSRSMRVTNCRQYNAGGAGFLLEAGCTDNAFTGCISGACAGHAWNVAGWNNFFASCKGFFAGWNGSAFDTSHNAWEITGGYNTLTSCSGQNGALHGFDLNGCSNVALVGCCADANNSGGGSGVGINTRGALHCAIVGCTGDNRGGTGQQLYGLQAAGTQTNTTFFANTVTGSTAAFNHLSGSGYSLAGPFNADFSGFPGGVEFGNVDGEVAGAGLRVKEGKNCKQGTAVLVAGTVTVAYTAVTASSRIFLTSQADGGTPGFLRVSARTPGTSFTITSSSRTDTSTVAYEIFEPG